MKYFIYTFFFEQDKYITLERLEKYLLCLMYMHSDEDGKLIVKQKEICDMANTSKTVLSLKKKYFEELGFMVQTDKSNIYMKIPKDVIHVQKIDMNEELITGKYRNLNNGAKLFYTYCLYQQELNGREYIKYTNVEIKKPFTGSINTIKKYCNELQRFDLLDRVRNGVSFLYHFKKIE